MKTLNRFRTGMLLAAGLCATCAWAEDIIEMAAYIPAPGTEIPIGTIVAWHKSATGTPALPNGWVECNGQILNEPISPSFGSSEFPIGATALATASPLPYYYDPSRPCWLTSGISAANQSGESRPDNMSVVWIIRVK